MGAEILGAPVGLFLRFTLRKEILLRSSDRIFMMVVLVPRESVVRINMDAGFGQLASCRVVSPTQAQVVSELHPAVTSPVSRLADESTVWCTSHTVSRVKPHQALSVGGCV